MDRTELLLEIEAAKQAIGEAEDSLRRIADGPTPPRDEETQVAERVRRTSLTLKTAEKKLIDLENLLSLAKIEEARKKVETAKAAVAAAEKNLDRVLGQMKLATPLQETWVTEVVEAAFSRLRAAREDLVTLKRSISAEAD